MDDDINDRELLNLSSEEKVLIIRQLQNKFKKSKAEIMHIEIMAAWENGYNQALKDAQKIAMDMHDEYDRDDPYCQGVCATALGIAVSLKKKKR